MNFSFYIIPLPPPPFLSPFFSPLFGFRNENASISLSFSLSLRVCVCACVRAFACVCMRAHTRARAHTHTHTQRKRSIFVQLNGPLKLARSLLLPQDVMLHLSSSLSSITASFSPSTSTPSLCVAESPPPPPHHSSVCLVVM